MTDEQIIKDGVKMRTYNGKVETSLWHCSIGICEGCHYYGYDRGKDCMKQLIKEAYHAHLSDERDLENQLRKIKAQNAEIERLQKYNTDVAFKHYNDGKSEGIKKFAERLKTKVCLDLCEAINCSDYLQDDFPMIVDNLVKEMAGEK